MNEQGPGRPRRFLAPRFSLRTLLIAMLLLGPLGAVGWKEWRRWRELEYQRAVELELRQERERAIAMRRAMFLRVGGVRRIEVDPMDIIRSDESFPESDPR